MGVSTAAPSMTGAPDTPPPALRYPVAAPLDPFATWPHPSRRAPRCAEAEVDAYQARRPTAAPAVRSTPDSATPGPATPAAYPVESALLQADRVALSVRAALERTAVPVARTATALVAAKAWCEFGFARLNDYARERLGRSGRWVRDLAALGDALTRLPALSAALTGSDGGRPLGRVAALLIARIATPDSLTEWIATARALSIRALRDAVRATREAGRIHDAASDPAAADFSAEDSPSADPDDVAGRILVRVSVPAPVLAAFDEAVDLYRAVEGGEASVTSFVEALVAESAATGDSPADPDTPAHPGAHSGHVARPAAHRSALPAGADARVLQSGPATAALERALATSTRNWAHLPDHVEASWALSLAGVTLARFNALAADADADAAVPADGRNAPAGRDAAADLDRRLRALVAIEDELESRLGALLADLADRRAWPRLRFAGVGHYGEERLGLSRSAAEDRARLARDLRRLPHLRAACAAGRVSRDAAALVARILRDAPAASTRSAAELAWVARASESTVKRMRDEARALGRYKTLGPRRAADPHPGHPHADDARAADPREPHPDTPSARLSPVGSASLTDRAPLTDPLADPAPLTDAEWHASLRRAPGLARRRIARFGALTLTSPDVFQALPLETDSCLRLRLRLDLGERFLAAIDSARRRLTAEADAIPWDEDVPAPLSGATEADADAIGPGAAAEAADSTDLPRYSRLAARMFSIRCRALPSWVGLLDLLEDFAATWDDPDSNPRRPGDEIYIRDGWRCMAPGCTSRRNLESHHLRYRSRGGGDEAPNLICLCRFHHQRGEHGDLASCRGRAPTDVEWRLGRASSAVWFRNERRIPAALTSGHAAS